MSDRKLRVFLCHSSNDKPAVRELYQRLKAEGWIDPWLDEEKLYPGQDWDLEIEKAVEAADAVIVFLSNNSVSKEGYIQRELRFVLRIADFKPNGTVFVIPVRLEDCPMPRRLSMWQFEDYFPEDRKDRAYQRLVFSLKVRASKLEIQTINLTEETKEKDKESQELEAARRAIKIKEIELKAVLEQADEIITKEKEERFRLGNELERKEHEKLVGKENEFDGQTFDALPDKLEFGEIELHRIPKGKFFMGEVKEQHEVNIPYDYFMARFPVTNQQFKKFVDATGFSNAWGVKEWNERLGHPVVGVSWLTAQAYCKWLNQEYGSELPVDLIFCLPTEAEWEKAARGTDGRMYPWGNEFDKNKCNSRESSSSSQTTPVGNYSPQGDSPYGISDMAGNVWEWTHSLYQAYPYKSDDGRESDSADGRRVIRGGSFDANASSLRAVFRGRYYPNAYDHDSGFRVALAPTLA